MSECKFCLGMDQYRRTMARSGSEPRGGLIVADLPASVALLEVDQYYRGYTVVMAKTHATELFQLPDEEADQFVRDMRAVAQAIASAFSPRKMNYELLGNTVPHLHWHLVPRYEWDENPKRPIWEHQHQPVLLDTERYAEIVELIRAHLKAPLDLLKSA